jgi:hypothetical protein
MPRVVSLFLPAWSTDRLRRIFPKLTDDGVGFTASRSHSGRAALSHKPGSLALSINPSKDDRDNYPPTCADDSPKVTLSANWSSLIGCLSPRSRQSILRGTLALWPPAFVLSPHYQTRPASIQSFHSVTHVSFSPGAPCFIIGEGARAIDSATIALRSSMVTGGLILASSFLTITPRCVTILSAFRHPSVFLRSLAKSQSEVTS